MTDFVQRELARGLTGHPTTDPVTEAVTKRIVEIARQYERAMHQVTARHGVSLGDCEVVWYLAHTDLDQHTPGLMAKAFHVTAGTMTSRLDRLGRAGYIDRSIDPGNRASIKVTLTDAGQALHHATADDMIALRHELIASELATDDLAALNTLLQRVLTGIETRFPPPRQREHPTPAGSRTIPRRRQRSGDERRSSPVDLTPVITYRPSRPSARRVNPS